jgi:hypothetical protein
MQQRYADTLDREYAARRLSWAEFAVGRAYRDLLVASMADSSALSSPRTVRGHATGCVGAGALRPDTPSRLPAGQRAMLRQEELVRIAGRDDERIVRSALIGNRKLCGSELAQFRAALGRVTAAVLRAEACATMAA